MDRYLARACPRCNGFVGIILHEPERETLLQAVNGHCVRCSYGMAWIVINGGRQHVISRSKKQGKLCPAASCAVTSMKSDEIHALEQRMDALGREYGKTHDPKILAK